MKDSHAIVIPTLNEESTIGGVLMALLRFPLVDWIVVVDDNSRDETINIVRRFSKKDPRARLIVRQGAKSFSHSYIEGFTYAIALGATVIIQMDADGSHDPAYLPAFFEYLKECDVVIGSRYIAGGRIKRWNFMRRALSRVGNEYARFLFGMPVYDLTGGFNGWKAATLKKIQFETISCNSYAFQIWLKWRAYRAHCAMKEIPIIFTERKSGLSKFTFGVILESFFEVVRMRWFDR